MVSYSRTTLLVGSGSVENAWAPVDRAIRACIPNAPAKDSLFIFAFLVFKLRWLVTKRDNSGKDAEFNKLICDLLKKTYETYYKVKAAITRELEGATESGELSLRPGIHKIASRFFTEETKIITTNWDLTILPFAKDSYDTHFLHGDVRDSLSLYLPMESIEEPYRARDPRGSIHGNLTGKALYWLEKTDQLLIYGLSLSPFDVDLCAVLSDSFYGTALPSRVVIVDPYHQRVAGRLRFLLPDVSPECMAPCDL